MTLQLDDRQLFDLARHAFTRLDGAWFLGAADRLGAAEAWDLDVEAWRRFSYVFGKHLRERFFPDPVWPDSFIEAMGLLSQILMIGERQVDLRGDEIIVRAADCEMRRMILKAGVAECGIATRHTYRGVAAGLFGKDREFVVEHLKNPDRGDDTCEVRIAPTQGLGSHIGSKSP